jgi:hypothetical protein
MQQGSVIREHRKLGPDVWCYRWWESGPSGKRVHRRIVLGTAEQLRDMVSARQMTAGLVQEINASDIRMTGKFMTLAQLADHFHQRELGRSNTVSRTLPREPIKAISANGLCRAGETTFCRTSRLLKWNGA